MVRVKFRYWDRFTDEYGSEQEREVFNNGKESN